MHHPLKPRILCIDDEAPVGELIRTLFESTGDFVVGVETKAIAAVNRARVFRPDLVFMDIKMPGVDGFALARDLRQEPWLRHRPILFFSGLSNVEDSIQKAWRSGPTEFLEKGVAASVIDQTVRRILAERLKQYHAVKKP
jgi:CheY-like chemotaxis protein